MATKKKRASKRKIKAKRRKASDGNRSHNWYLVLQRDGNAVRVQPDWTNEVKEGDTVSFVSPDGTPKVIFSKGVALEQGKRVSVSPLSTDKIEGGRRYRVMRASSGTIECSLEVETKAKKGKSRKMSLSYSYLGSQGGGATYCWKGSTLVPC